MLTATLPPNSLKLTSDTKYLYVDSTADTADGIGIASGEIVLADKYGSSSAPIYKDNVIVISNVAKEAVLVVVDVKNNMTNTNNTLNAASTFSAATVVLSKTSGIKAGDAIDVTITNETGSTIASDSIALTNAVLADGTTSITITNLADGASMKVTIFADGNGNVGLAD